jgi:hypothetical protein
MEVMRKRTFRCVGMLARFSVDERPRSCPLVAVVHRSEGWFCAIHDPDRIPYPPGVKPEPAE